MKSQWLQQKTQRQHTDAQWKKKFNECGRACHYCHKSLTLDEATKDHQTPLCRGGSDKIENIVPACIECNQRKAWRTEEEFLKVLPMLSTKRRNSLRGNPYKKAKTSLEERENEPGLLKKVVTERERTSWAWRNPCAS
jgi:uncharacterized protein YjhX (UPF0386 family)